MVDSPDSQRGKTGADLPGGRFNRVGWRIFDPLYVWSAAVGVFVALVLIAVVLVMRTLLPQ